MRVHRAVLTGRRADHHATHARHQRGNGVHQQAGHQRRAAALAPGHIQAHAVDGHDLLPEDAAVRARFKPGFFQLIFVETPDIFSSKADIFAAFRGNAGRAPRYVLRRKTDRQLKGFAVKLARIFHKSVVALFTDSRQKFAHLIFHGVAGVVAGVKPAGSLDPFLFVLQVQQTARHAYLLSFLGKSRASRPLPKTPLRALPE